jgi:hypothetical protein
MLKKPRWKTSSAQCPRHRPGHEFLPISSSGHLIAVRELFDWGFTDDLTFDVSLHLGTTAAVLAYFWRDWLTMARATLRWLSGDRERRLDNSYDAHTLGLLVSISRWRSGSRRTDRERDPLSDHVV